MAADEPFARTMEQVTFIPTTGGSGDLIVIEVVIFVEGTDINDHHLDGARGGKATHRPHVFGVIDKALERCLVIEHVEVLLGALEALLNALANGDTRYYDNELGQPIATIELVDSANIDIGLARTGFHFNGKIAQMPVGSNTRRSERVAFLDHMQVTLELGRREPKAVGMAHLSNLSLQNAGTHLRNEVRVHKLLASKQITDGVDGLDLVLLISGIFYFQSHALHRPQLYLVTGPFLHTPKRLDGIELERIGKDRVAHEHTARLHVGNSIEHFHG